MTRIKNAGMKCSIDGCTKSAHCRGLCQVHYQKALKLKDEVERPVRPIHIIPCAEKVAEPQPVRQPEAKLTSCEYKDGQILFTIAINPEQIEFFDVIKRNLVEQLLRATPLASEVGHGH